MKKLTLAFLAIITLLASCNSDDPEDNGGDHILSKIKKTLENGSYITKNYESNEKETTNYYVNTLLSENEYDAQDFMTSKNYYQGNDVYLQYDYNYDVNGNLESFHYFKNNGGFENFDLDITLAWNGNNHSYTLDYDNYDFNFDDDGLITKFTLSDNYSDDMTLNFEYDVNENVTHFYGFYSDLYGNPINFDVNITYDDKVNPFYAHFHKYYIQNLIDLCRESGFYGYPILDVYPFLGKNNPLNFSGNYGGEAPNLHFTHEYDGDYPTKSLYKREDGTVKSTTEFIYQ